MKWLSVLGVGEEGLAGLSPVARLLYDQAEILVGGARHLAMLPADDSRQQLVWGQPIQDSVSQIVQWRGRSVCVLASGDPMWYGIGTTLLRQIPLDELTIVPALSAFSLAAARLGWSLTEVETLSLCGRDPNLIQALIYPGAKLLVLSENRHTPARVAQILTQRGFGRSAITVLEQMGGSRERIVTAAAATELEVTADLNTLAVDCVADSNAEFFSRLAGLPDSAYQHDGQLTKREVRAMTLAALAPLPGRLLWDVGAGCGSIGIEWMRSHPRCRAIAIEQHPTRLQYIAANAVALGVPTLRIVAGKAPAALQDLPQPDAVFIGGGVTAVDLLETCWQALRPGGQLVVNAVTVESEQLVFQQQQRWGGSLTRMAIQRAEAVGSFLGWKAMAPITQWSLQKTVT